MVILGLILFGFVGFMIYLLISKIGKLGMLAIIAGVFYLLTQSKAKKTA
jgi:uncharacterized membrane protein